MCLSSYPPRRARHSSAPCPQEGTDKTSHRKCLRFSPLQHTSCGSSPRFSSDVRQHLRMKVCLQSEEKSSLYGKWCWYRLVLKDTTVWILEKKLPNLPNLPKYTNGLFGELVQWSLFFRRFRFDGRLQLGVERVNDLLLGTFLRNEAKLRMWCRMPIWLIEKELGCRFRRWVDRSRADLWSKTNPFET